MRKRNVCPVTTLTAALCLGFFAPTSLGNTLLERLQEAEPDIIMVGNSMQGEGIDFEFLSNELGAKVFDARSGGAVSMWQTAVLQHVLPKLETKPKMVLVVERRNHFTAPQMRVQGYYANVLKLVGEEDWSVIERLSVFGEGQPDWEKEGGELDGFFWDFEQAVNWSLLPHMIRAAQEQGFQLVVVRHKARQFAEEPDWYPEEMQRYTEQMAYYLASHGVPFLDYDRHPAIEGDLYANGDHLNREGKIIWTDLMVEDIKALLADERALNLRLPPEDFRPSAKLSAAAAELAVLPEPAPEPPRVAWIPTPEEIEERERRAAERAAMPVEQRKSPATSILESIINLGRNVREEGIIIVPVMIPSPETNLGRFPNTVSKTVKGGVPVDLTEAFVNAENRDELYLTPATLSPRGIELVAEAVAEVIRENLEFVAVPLESYDATRALIETPDGQVLEINQVHRERSRQFIEPTHQTRLVVVGDRNVGLYSDPTLGMGHSAGLGEHLSRHLGRPFQWHWSNAHPKDGILEALAEVDLERTTVIVWVFMADHLFEDEPWGPIPAPQLKEYDQPDRLVVSARISRASPSPAPDLMERYPDTVNYTLWEIESVQEGEYDGKELLTVEWSQKDLEFLRPFDYQPGQEFTLELIPLSRAMRQDRFIRRADFVDAVQRDDLPPFWVESHEAR